MLAVRSALSENTTITVILRVSWHKSFPSTMSEDSKKVYWKYRSSSSEKTKTVEKKETRINQILFLFPPTYPHLYLLPCCGTIHNSYGHYMNCTVSSSCDVLIRRPVNRCPWVSRATCTAQSQLQWGIEIGFCKTNVIGTLVDVAGLAGSVKLRTQQAPVALVTVIIKHCSNWWETDDVSSAALHRVYTWRDTTHGLFQLDCRHTPHPVGTK